MSSRTKQQKQKQTSKGGGGLRLVDLMTGSPPPAAAPPQQQPQPDTSGDTTEVSTDEYDVPSPELLMSQLQRQPPQQRFTRGRSLTDDWNDNAISPQPKLQQPQPPTPKAVRGRRTLSGVNNSPAALTEPDFRVVKAEPEPPAVKVEPEPPAVKVESEQEPPAVKVEPEQEPPAVKQEPSGVKRERERDERPQPDAMPPLTKKIPNLPNYRGIFDEVNDLPLAEMDLAGYTPDAGRILKAKFFISLFTAEPLGLSSSAYSGLKGADEVWHEFIERHPEAYEAFGRSLGYEGGIPHTPGSGSVADVVRIEARFIRKYKRIFREMPTIPEPEQELLEEYAEEWEQDDEVVCG